MISRIIGRNSTISRTERKDFSEHSRYLQQSEIPKPKLPEAEDVLEREMEKSRRASIPAV